MSASQNAGTDLSMAKLAKITGISRQTLLNQAKSKELPGAYRVGKLWRFRAEQLPFLRGEVSSTVAQAK